MIQFQSFSGIFCGYSNVKENKSKACQAPVLRPILEAVVAD